MLIMISDAALLEYCLKIYLTGQNSNCMKNVVSGNF